MTHLKKYKKLYLTTFGIIIGLVLLVKIFAYFLKIQIKTIPNSTIILDQNSNQIGRIVKDKKYRHIESGYENFPNFFVSAIVLIEDKSFWTNNGISLRSVARSIYNNLSSNSPTQGGSTISAQLIRNSYGLNERRNLIKKIHEFTLAYAANHQFSKKEIITKYLNLINFGYLCYGPHAASKYYFNKELSNLTKAEQIALITLIKNPEKYNPFKNFDNFFKRYNILIDYLYENKLFDKDEYTLIKNEKLMFTKYQGNKLPYVTDFVLQHFNSQNTNKVGHKDLFPSNTDLSGGNIYTTIDYDLSKQIENIANSTLEKLAWKGVNDYGILILSRNDLSLKVMLGGSNYQNLDGQVNSTIALRQPGSTVKVFTYLLAFKNLGLNPGSLITDLPVNYKTARGYSYTPKNYTLKYKGQVDIATALSESLNVPAVKTLDMIGIQSLLDFLRLLGISSLNNKAEHYGLALTLGVGEVSLYELTRGFSIFSKQGELCDIKILQTQSTQCKQIIENEYIEQIVTILTNRYFKINGFPINSNLDFKDRYVFVKTGTSREFKDNFAIGFTQNYIIGVWVGNKSGEKMKLVTGVAGAGDIFRKIVEYLEKPGYENKPIKLEKTEEKYLEINNPSNNSVYSYDRYNHVNNQKLKLKFSTNIQYTNYGWILNGKKLENDELEITPGIHRIKIILFDGGKKISEKENIFEVK